LNEPEEKKKGKKAKKTGRGGSEKVQTEPLNWSSKRNIESSILEKVGGNSNTYLGRRPEGIKRLHVHGWEKEDHSSN